MSRLALYYLCAQCIVKEKTAQICLQSLLCSLISKSLILKSFFTQCKRVAGKTWQMHFASSKQFMCSAACSWENQVNYYLALAKRHQLLEGREQTTERIHLPSTSRLLASCMNGWMMVGLKDCTLRSEFAD